ncbi:MAG: hypothetical protein C0504_13315 [Candidatus Solibacter sp.]|nr:hypothetical protein [Candidatus Solibacter sp.]
MPGGSHAHRHSVRTAFRRAGGLEWFREQGFGLSIHRSHDSQPGSVISHPMAGADVNCPRRFVHDLPKTFNPMKFNPADWAALAKLAAVRYVVFTANRHSGFRMYGTRTAKIQIMPVQAQRHARGARCVPGAGHRTGTVPFAGRLSAPP